MSRVKFDKVPTRAESLNVDAIGEEMISQAWQSYEAKPEYKKFNKHDMIESMLSTSVENVQKQSEDYFCFLIQRFWIGADNKGGTAS